MTASREKHPEVVKILLEAKADNIFCRILETAVTN